jgi:hypothetical protein
VVKQAAWRAAVNGINSPTRAPVLALLPGGVAPARHPSGCGGASRDTVGLLVTTPALPADRGDYFVGLGNRPDLQAKVEM